MPPFSSESATLPRDFRFHYQDGDCPKTPEPVVNGEPPQPPSPPRAPRLKIRRRNASQISAPTEQFLASVAAADIPLPTIEIPQFTEDEDMPDRSITPNPVLGLLTPYPPGLGSSPPRTPLPQLITSVDDINSQRRDWYMKSAETPEDSLSIPSSAVSDPSDWSDDSFFSRSRISRPSDDGSCTSPDSDVADPFMSLSKSRGKESTLISEDNWGNQDVLNGRLRSKSRNDAAWSKDMTEHLWQTYQVYLQDPTVTPFRIGASAVPPEGVICRVAREAKRSWKGPKKSYSRNLKKRRASSLTMDYTTVRRDFAGSPDTTATSKSGSLTPTGESTSKTYIQWQHSSAATRNHLRELCKRKDSTSVQKHRHLQSRSPTPFTQTRVLASSRLRTSNLATQSSFSTKDIALTLTTSSAESMQPDGPLAKLTASSGPSSLPSTIRFRDVQHIAGSGNNVHASDQLRRLGSPFTSRTYGPSSSSIFGSLLTTSPPFAQSNSVTGPRLRSPLHFDYSRSLNGTQKRRAQHPLEEELSPNGAVVRPSILDDQLFGGELENQQRRVRSRGFSLGDAVLGNHLPSLFGAQTDGALTILGQENTDAPKSTTPLLPSVEFKTPRLGSPFSESVTSHTFPRRLFQPIDGTSTVRKRAFATVHHTRRSIESFDFGEGPSLQSRLTQLDQKLAEIRDRESIKPGKN